MKKQICVICKLEYDGFGNNAEPIKKGRCCDKCNSTKVLLARLINFKKFKNIYAK